MKRREEKKSLTVQYKSFFFSKSDSLRDTVADAEEKEKEPNPLVALLVGN